ncbi:AAA family ATPase [Leeia oryzae]|uniref:AAA family ATPase n=1 Tax=Leeia oryzae TaxID=356662 RepID=UPI00036D0B7C|nr:ATP-binding protein [Leeia oryzae]
MSSNPLQGMNALPAKLVGNSFSGALILTSRLSEAEYRFLTRVLQLVLPRVEKPAFMDLALLSALSVDEQTRLTDNPARLLCAYGPEAIAYCQNTGFPFLPLPAITTSNYALARAEATPAQQLVLFGPESVGKSTLAKQLAVHFQVPYLDEYVRLWFDVFHNQCDEQDANTIMLVQQALNQAYAGMTESPWIVCDTNVLSSIMWYTWYFGALPDAGHVMAETQEGVVYLLLDDDLPFVPDHQRKYPDRREFGSDHAESWLQKYGCRYERIGGAGADRLNAAVASIRRLLVL